MDYYIQTILKHVFDVHKIILTYSYLSNSQIAR